MVAGLGSVAMMDDAEMGLASEMASKVAELINVWVRKAFWSGVGCGIGFCGVAAMLIEYFFR